MTGDPSILPARWHFKYETLCPIGERRRDAGVPFCPERFQV
jgi:hypothetical protein